MAKTERAGARPAPPKGFEGMDGQAAAFYARALTSLADAEDAAGAEARDGLRRRVRAVYVDLKTDEMLGIRPSFDLDAAKREAAARALEGAERAKRGAYLKIDERTALYLRQVNGARSKAHAAHGDSRALYRAQREREEDKAAMPTADPADLAAMLARYERTDYPMCLEVRRMAAARGLDMPYRHWLDDAAQVLALAATAAKRAARDLDPEGLRAYAESGELERIIGEALPAVGPMGDVPAVPYIDGEPEG